MKRCPATVRSNIGVGAVVAVLLLLTACSPAVLSPPTATALTQFRVSARITVHPHEGGIRRFPVVWQRLARADGGTEDDIRIHNPLGGVVGQIKRTPTESALTWRGKTINAADSTELAERLLGYPLPVDAIGYWLQGMPAPAATAAEIISDETQRIRAINQHGWRISYRQYNQQGQPIDIRLAAPNAQIDVHIKQWLITP